MADIGASNWSETDGSNTSAAPDGMPEGMAPSGVNDWGRATMGAVKRWYDQTIPKVTAGSSTVYTLAYSVAPTLNDGMTHLIRFHTTNGAAPTLNVNGLGAKPLFAYIAGTWMAAPEGSFPTDYIARIAYDNSSGNYRILGMHTCLGVKAFAGSPAVADFINIPATANSFELRFNLIPSVDGPDVGIQVYKAGVLSAGGSDYQWTTMASTSAGLSPTGAGSAAAGSIKLASAIDSLHGCSGAAKFEGVLASNGSPLAQYQASYSLGTGATLVNIAGAGHLLAAGLVTGIRVGLSSGGANGISTASLYATI